MMRSLWVAWPLVLSSPRTDLGPVRVGPGVIAQLLQASGVPIDRYSFETAS